MINDKISIIVPVYNLENYIVKTLESICNQTYKNIEVLVVDDGSKDNSWNIISDFAKKDDRVKPIHQENGGVTSARLNGVKNATGEWIGFVDGDDLIDKDMYETLINNACKYNADISHCGYRMVFEDGRVNYFYNTGCLVEQDNLKGLCDLLDGSFIEPGLWNKLFHNTLFHSLLHENIMDKSIKINEDLLMNFYLFQASKKSIFEDVCKYQYIVRQGSASRSVSENSIFDPIKVKEIIYNDAPEDFKIQAKKALVGTCLNQYCVLSSSKQNVNNYRNAVYQKLLEHKNDAHLLSKKQKLLFRIASFNKGIFKIFYGIYSKYFQKKRYE